MKHLDDYTYLGEASIAIDDARYAFGQAHNWTIDIESGQEVKAPDLLELYQEWSKAKHFLLRYKRLDADMQEKEQSVYQIEKPGELYDKIAELEGFTMGWEERAPELIAKVIDDQLKESADEWQKYLEKAVDVGLDDSALDPMEAVDDYCDFRDNLEYVKMGLEMVRLEQPRLKAVSYLSEFEKRLKDLDVIFERVLGGRREVEPYADKTFWWRHKSK